MITTKVTACSICQRETEDSAEICTPCLKEEQKIDRDISNVLGK